MTGGFDFRRGGERAEAAKRRAADRARLCDALLESAAFREWLSSWMAEVGYFGEGRELTAYRQGYRGAVVRMAEEVVERGERGEEFLVEAFRRMSGRYGEKER